MMEEVINKNKGTAIYSYNGLNKRVGQTLKRNNKPEEKINYTLDLIKPFKNILEREVNGEKEEYIWDRNLLGTMEDDIYLIDRKGSIIRTIEKDMEEIFSYDEFGIEKEIRNTNSQPFGYTGYQYDDISELNFAEARYYDELHGRFTGVDNIKGYMTYPDSLNPYVYAYNKPEDYVDEDGNIAVSVKTITILKFAGVGAGAGFGKQYISDFKTNYKEYKFDISEWELSPLRDYAGSTVKGAIVFPLAQKSPISAAGLGKFTETLIKGEYLGDALGDGSNAAIKAGVLKGINFGVRKLTDVAGIEIDILGKAENLPGKWGYKVGIVVNKLSENAKMVKNVAKGGFNENIDFENILIYKISSSIKSNIKKPSRKYIETKIENKQEKKRINDIFCPA